MKYTLLVKQALAAALFLSLPSVDLLAQPSTTAVSKSELDLPEDELNKMLTHDTNKFLHATRSNVQNLLDDQPIFLLRLIMTKEGAAVHRKYDEKRKGLESFKEVYRVAIQKVGIEGLDTFNRLLGARVFDWNFKTRELVLEFKRPMNMDELATTYLCWPCIEHVEQLQGAIYDARCFDTLADEESWQFPEANQKEPSQKRRRIS